MKVLFIKLDIGSQQNGGVVVQKRNILLYQEKFGKYNVDEICIPKKVYNSLPKKIFRFFERLIKANTWAIEDKMYNELLTIIPQYDIVHFDTSILGYLIRDVKSRGFHGIIISFFHNIESCFNTVLIKKLGFLSFLYTCPIKRSEALTCKYADYIFNLNDRDCNILQSMYHRKADLLLPISVNDSYVKYDNVHSDFIELLFVGSYFFANISSLKWFDKDVVPYLNSNIKITIVGNGMSKIRDDLSSNIYEIHDFVEDLSVFYKRASAVILPIQEGGGMKIKTCEALMWGKYLLGTTEAFQGYNITEKEGVLCDSAEMFINEINKLSHLGQDSFCEYSRNLYLRNFTNELMLEKINKCLNLP